MHTAMYARTPHMFGVCDLRAARSPVHTSESRGSESITARTARLVRLRVPSLSWHLAGAVVFDGNVIASVLNLLLDVLDVMCNLPGSAGSYLHP